MTPSTVFQALNTAAIPQSGGSFVAETTIGVPNGGDLLLGVSASAWSQAAGPLSLEVWLDGEPTGGLLAMNASTGLMHLSLGHTWVLCPGVEPGSHTLALVAGPSTVTDNNDGVNVTVWELGDGVTVPFTSDEPATGQVFMKEQVQSHGIQMLVSGGASGWVGSSALVGANLTIDSAPPAASEVFANNPNQHLATVPTTFLAPQPLARGEHLVMLAAESGTSTDLGDTGHLAVVDWVNPADAPAVLPLSPALQNAQAQAQHGDGGSIASATFESNGGTLLVSSHVSAWTQNVGQSMFVGVQIDGTSRGFNSMYANFAETHLTMISNDVVVTGIPAGQHTLNLMGEAGTITDANDRVSVTILEFPA